MTATLWQIETACQCSPLILLHVSQGVQHWKPSTMHVYEFKIDQEMYCESRELLFILDLETSDWKRPSDPNVWLEIVKNKKLMQNDLILLLTKQWFIHKRSGSIFLAIANTLSAARIDPDVPSSVVPSTHSCSILPSRSIAMAAHRHICSLLPLQLSPPPQWPPPILLTFVYSYYRNTRIKIW